MTKSSPKASESISRHDLGRLVLRCIDRYGWQHLSLNHLSTEGHISLAAIHEHASDKPQLFALIADVIEHETQTIDETDQANLEPHELIFEVLMARFDALTPYKSAIEKLIDDLKRDPAVFPVLIPHALERIKRLALKAGIIYDGVLAPLQYRAFGLLYLKLLHTWLMDASMDLSKTMSACDKAAKDYVPCIQDPCKLADLF